jgi:hypothetical protein
MLTDPSKHLIIPIIPTTTAALREEDPGLIARTKVHRDAIQLVSRLSASLLVIRFPHGGLKPLSAGVTDGDIGEDIVIIIGNERLGEELEEGMIGRAAEDVVAESPVAAVCGEGWVVEKGFKVSETALQNHLLKAR